MFARIRNFGLILLVVGTASLSAFAQSTMPFTYLPPGFVPGRSLMQDPNASNDTSSQTGMTTLTTRPRHSYFSSKDFQFEYTLILLGLQEENQYESFQLVSSRVYSIIKYRMADELLLWVEPFLIFRTGADQATEGHNRNSTIFIAKDASMIWTPFAWWQLRAGIMDQNFYHSFLMLEDQSFPGIRSTWYGGSPDLGASLVGEQSLLNFSSNTNNSNQVEKTPTLSSVSAEAHYKFTNRSQIKFSAGYWQYENLPSAVAAEAMLTGNTVHRNSDTFSVFAYQFRGYEVRTRLEMGFGPVDWNVYSEGLMNTEAPSGMNTGWNAGNEFVYRGIRNRKYGLNFEYYHLEPDAAVSYYNAFEFDRSNRNGVMAMTYFKWGAKKQQKVSLRYVNSTLVYYNAPQSESTQVRLRWETDYDFL